MYKDKKVDNVWDTEDTVRRLINTSKWHRRKRRERTEQKSCVR